MGTTLWLEQELTSQIASPQKQFPILNGFCKLPTAQVLVVA